MDLLKEFNNMLLRASILNDPDNKEVVEKLIEMMKDPKTIEASTKNKEVHDIHRATLLLCMVVGEGLQGTVILSGIAAAYEAGRKTMDDTQENLQAEMKLNREGVRGKQGGTLLATA